MKKPQTNITLNKFSRFFPIIVGLVLAASSGTYLFLTHKPNFISDTRIVKANGAYAYQNLTNEFQTRFKEKPTTKNSIVFSNSLGKISFFTTPSQPFGELKPTDSPSVTQNQLTYPNLFDQLDLRYTVSSSRLLEEFVVKDVALASAITSIVQQIQTTNNYEQNDDGSITFRVKDQIAFVIPPPIMYEMGNPEEKSSGIKYEVNNSDGIIYVSKVITEEGKAWLADPARIYPIIIDLVIDNADTSSNWVSSDTVNTPVSAEGTIKQEGAGSTKILATGEANITLDLMEYSSGANARAAYVAQNSASILASGGTMTTVGTDQVHTFTSSGTFSVSDGSGSVQHFIVGGGGGGGWGWYASVGSGGGAGGYRAGSSSVAAGNYGVGVGLGGAGGSQWQNDYRGYNGGNSSFNGHTAYGGEGGFHASQRGGNSGAGDTQYYGGAGLTDYPGGGAGNAANGEQGLLHGASAGYGGSGVYSAITGSGAYYGGGGGGGSLNNVQGAGGTGGGGAGGKLGPGIAGTPNTGGGGGGGGHNSNTSYDGGYGGSGIVVLRYPKVDLQSYNDSSIKTEGSYALKGYAAQTTALNKTLVKTLASPVNLSNRSEITFDLRASRTGSNIKIGLHDAGGTTTEITPNITGANSFQNITWNISGVSNANKDAIDRITITIVNADANNTFYLDNLRSRFPSLNDTVTRTMSPVDLSSVTHFSFWVYSPKVGSYARLEFGETNSNEQSLNFTINNANTWEQKTWDIIGITATSRDAVTKFAFRIIGDSDGQPLYFDNIETFTVPAIPTIGTATPLSSSSIRWGFTDNANNEQGFRVFNPGDSITNIDGMEYSTDSNAQDTYITNSTSALGGTIANITGYRTHTFTSDGILSFIATGNIEALVVGGGGGSFNGGSGGGGGGKVTTGTYTASASSYTITVGSGGTPGNNGGTSSIGSLVSSIGGNTSSGRPGGTSGNGYSGGGYANNYSAGGGGGASSDGQNSYEYWEASTELTRPHGGNGGDGITSSITGSTASYGGGGGGWSEYTAPGIGQAGGGNGGVLYNPPSNGTANTGGGAGGGYGGGYGGSGIVVIRYPTPGLEAFSESTIKNDGSNSLKIIANQTTSLNKTLTRTLSSPIDLSSYSYFSLDIRSNRTGANLKIGLHDTGGVTSEFIPSITTTDSFQSFEYDISGINNTNMDSIDQITITIINADTTATYYLDYLRASLSGGKITTCSEQNRTYCDETGLLPNTQYTRKVLAYNDAGESQGSASTSTYTHAAVPDAPTLSSRTTTSVQINPSAGINPANTQLAIYRVTNSTTCNGSGGVYIAANGSNNGSTPIWQTDATWATVTVSGLTAENTYSFCVKAKNANNIETTFSPIGSKDNTYVPISGDFVCTENTVNSNTFVNRYVDSRDINRYVIALDDGNTPNRTTFEAKNCIMTLNATDTLVAGQLKLSGGSIAIAQGAEIKVGQPVWILDANANGYSADGKIYFEDGVGRRRKNLATTLAVGSNDCNDTGGGTVIATTLYRDADGDGYGNPNVSIFSCPTSGYVSNNSDCGDSSANARPNQTVGYATSYTNNSGSASYDWNCDGSYTTYGTKRYNYANYYYYSNSWGCNANEVCRNTCSGPSGSYNLTTTGVSCGVGGYARSTYVGFNNNNPGCTGCYCNGYMEGYVIGAYATQQCL